MGWKEEAFDRLPEARPLLEEDGDLPYEFVGGLVPKLEAAYTEGNEDLIERIYRFVFWCMDASRGKGDTDDLFTAVACSFLEQLPKYRRIRQDIGRWFGKEDIEAMEKTFRYHGTEEEYQEMLRSSEAGKARL
jgi:hypothetical protein